MDMVSKLGLALVEHPNPYRATWVNQELNVKVSQKVLVNFSIGPYHDQVWCDVISMNCGHMILGRPWKCMRKIIHDGYTNTYIVHKGKENFKLNPLTSRDKDKVLMCFGDNIPFHRQGNIQNDTSWKQC